MLLFNALIFDDVLSDTGSVFYSRADFFAMVGRADVLAFQVCTTNVSGTGTTLTLDLQTSANAENWVTIQTLTWLAVNDDSNGGWNDGLNDVLGEYVRMRLTLTGTNPQCRAKIYVTGRGRAAEAPPGGGLRDAS